MSESFDVSEPAVPWSKTPSVDPEEFHSAFILYVNAAARKVLVQNPAKREPFLAEEEDGSIGVYSLADIPESRGLTALSSRYKDDPQMYRAISRRIYALTGLIGTKTLEGWCKKTTGGYDVHDAVIDAAAGVEMTNKGKFPRVKFLREVARIAEEKFSDE